MKVGSLYCAKGLPPATAANLIADGATQQGFAVDRQDVPHGKIIVRACQRAAWYHVIAGALVNILIWEIRPEGCDAIVFQTRKCFWWYRLFLLGLAVLLGECWIHGFLIQFYAENLYSVALLPIALMLTFLSYRQLCASGRSGVLERTIASNFRDEGTALESESGRCIDPQIVAGGLVISYLLLLAGPTVFWPLEPSSSQIPAWVRVLLCLLVLLLGCLCSLIVVIARKRSAMSRIAIALPGGSLCLAVTFLLGAQLPYYVFADLHQDDLWNRLFAVQRQVEDGLIVLPDGNSESAEAWIPFLQQVRVAVALFLALSATMCALALGFVISSVASAKEILEIRQRLSLEHDTAYASAAISGKGFLGRFRVILLALWVIWSSLIVVGAASIVLHGFVALFWPDANAAPVGVVAGSINAVAFVLQCDPNEMSIRFITRSVWVIGAALVLTITLVPAIVHVVNRRRVRAKLQRNSAVPTRMPIASASSMLSRLSAHIGCEPPGLAITPARRAFATAHAFGIGKREQFIELSTRCMEILSAGELEALLAHELAHHISKHCRKHNTLHWLARVSFVGGGFAAVIEDSFGYELEADRVAVSQLGIDRGVLKTCLMKVRMATELDFVRHLNSIGGLDLLPSSQDRSARAHGSHLKAMAERLLSRLRQWWIVYNGDESVAYWHPSFQERVKQLSERPDE